MPIVYVVIPCFNEQAVLTQTAVALADKLGEMQCAGQIDANSRVLFVDDGSADGTWATIEQLHRENALFSGIKLTRNRGQQNALLAGMLTAAKHADIILTMDADLQDDVSVMDQFVSKYQEGCDIVYGVRSTRKTDSAFKRGSARTFYRLMRSMGVELVYDHADYRLMSRRAVNALAQFKEVNLFLRGMVPLIGFPCGTVSYERQPRAAGKTSYPFHKMLHFAWDGVTSFSVKPIRLITALGFIVFLISLGFLAYSIIVHCLGYTVTGWSSLIVSIWAIGGLQILSIGVIGEYIARIYLETKHRPPFLIEQQLPPEEKDN